MGYRAIHVACMYGHTELVEMLIKAKDDINCSDRVRGLL